jgi:YVTN family beta-propeller protein
VAAERRTAGGDQPFALGAALVSDSDAVVNAVKARTDPKPLADTAEPDLKASSPAPGGPDCMEVLAGGKMLLVSSRWARKLTVIDTEAGKVVRQIKVGKSPHGVWTLDHAPR